VPELKAKTEKVLVFTSGDSYINTKNEDMASHEE
jgi:hypothetical protein